MQMMSSLDRSAQMCSEARTEATKSRSRVKTLTQDLAEFQEMHSATIDSLKTECEQVRAEVAIQRRKRRQRRLRPKQPGTS